MKVNSSLVEQFVSVSPGNLFSMHSGHYFDHHQCRESVVKSASMLEDDDRMQNSDHSF